MHKSLLNKIKLYTILSVKEGIGGDEDKGFLIKIFVKTKGLL
jgi:hypothetical protein